VFLYTRDAKILMMVAQSNPTVDRMILGNDSMRIMTSNARLRNEVVQQESGHYENQILGDSKDTHR